MAIQTLTTGGAVLLALVRRLARDGTATRLREAAHLSLGDVARSLDVHPSTVLRWESGESLPRGAVAMRYGALLAELDALGEVDGLLDTPTTNGTSAGNRGSEKDEADVTGPAPAH
jgi:transcriptional regulator with XRE-family HTH domain